MAPPCVMPPEKMKPLLTLSKAAPVQAAIALTRDGDGLMFLHKKAKPRKVLSMLREAAKKSNLVLNGTSLRFGRALVDVDYDPGMVRFFVNKEAPGMMRAKLIQVVKLASYQKVEINVDPSLEAEAEDDDEDGDDDGLDPTSDAAKAPAVVGQTRPDSQTPAAAPAPAAAAAPAAAGANAGALAKELAALARRIPEAAGRDADLRARLLKVATEANAALKTNALDDAVRLLADLRAALDAGDGSAAIASADPAPAGRDAAANGVAAAPVEPDAGAVRKTLVALAGRIAGSDPAGKAALAQLATKANAALKAGNLAACAAALDQLRAALGQGGAGGAEPASGWKKAADAWRDANDAVSDQLNALIAAIRADVQAGGDDVDEIADDLTEIADKGLNAMMAGQRVPLMAALQELAGGDAAAMGKFGAQALACVSAFQAHLQSSPQIEACDENPFGVAVSIRASLAPALQQMAAALQPAAPPAA